jgi:hypothetical protein
MPNLNPEVFVGGCVVPHPFKTWEGHVACADCHGARHAKLGDNRVLHPTVEAPPPSPIMQLQSALDHALKQSTYWAERAAQLSEALLAQTATL